MSLPDPWIGRMLGGRYRLVRPLGAGGAGAVYEAEQVGIGRAVAVKLMRPELAADADQLERFRREARAAAQLGHPHIVQLFDFADAHAGEPAYLVLELVRGRSLFQLLREEAPLAPARAVALACQILAALESAHRAGIVHRDMKPANVVVAELPGLGEIAKVLDFGIARVQESEAYQRLTRTGVIIGTPRYMSPEQASGRPVDGRTDLWAVGIVLYAALTARFPFEGSPTDVVLAIVSAPVPPMGRPDLPPALEAAVRKALEKQPEHRHASAESMAEALRAALVSPSAGAAPERPSWSGAHGSFASPQSTGALAWPHGASALAAPQPTGALGSPHATSALASPHGAGALGSPHATSALASPQPTGALAAPHGAGALAWPQPTGALASPQPAAAASGLASTPVWARWLAAVVVLGGLGAATFLVVVLATLGAGGSLPGVRSAPASGAAPSPLAPPVLVDPGDAPTRGPSSAFLDDALARARARDPAARLGMISGVGVVPATGEIDVDAHGSWSFGFLGGDGHAFHLMYAAGGETYPLVLEMGAMLGAFPTATPDSPAIARVALAACPGLMAHDAVYLSTIASPSGPTLAVSVVAGPTWSGRLDGAGGITTVMAYQCN